jgi:membrane fusion protein (multidrug efflux system)
VEPVKSSKQITKAKPGRELRRADPERREVRQFIAVPIRPARLVPARLQVAARELTLRARRHYGEVIACVVLLLLAAPVAAWLHYRSDYVTSRNAMVKGQLAQVGTRLDGVLIEFKVADGERVRVGQVLARLDDSRIRGEVQAARAEVAGLERELEIERSAIDHEQRVLQNSLREAAANLGVAAAEVEAAESQAENAQAYYRARQTLFATGGAISGELVREAQAKARTARALVKSARAEYAAAQSAEQRAQLDSEGLALRKQRIAVLEAGLSRGRARLAVAQADLEGTMIRAPADGAVVRRILQPGGSVGVGTPVISLWLGDDVWIEAWLEEDDIPFVKMGSVARVTLQSFPGQEFVGVVGIGLTTDFEMPPSEVPQPRFARMRGAPVVGVGIRLEDPPAQLLPGLSAVVGIRKSGA